MDRNQRRPPDVEEALSSMLWTPYERTPSDSSSDEDDKLNSKLKKSKSSFDYAFPTYVPSYRKIERYDNFRFSYPYYGPIPTVQKCITEPPSYESLYNVTPVLTSITGLSGRLVHSFTDNFIAQNQPVALHHSVLPTETETALLHITSSVSGFSNNFADHGIGSDVIAIPCLDDPAAAAVAITNGTKEITREESRRSDNGDLLPAIDDDHGMARLQPKHHQQHHQRQRSLQATSTNTSADLAEEPRVSKPRRYSPADPFPPASLNPVVVAVTNGCVRQASEHRYDHFVGLRECGAQTSHDQCIEASLLRTTEVSGALVFAGDFSDAANYFVESVSSESGDIRNLAVDARSKSVAMRLNVPAASSAATASKDASEVNNSGCNPASTTSIFLSTLGNDSNNHQINNVAVSRRGLIAHGTVMGAIVPPQPSLTIQVNQGSSESCASDQARSVVNQSSGIVSVVNCFSSSVPHVNSVNNERSEVGIVPNAATAAATTTTTITGPSGGPSVSGDISNSGGLSPIRSTHLRTLERTFTSTECQTDDLNLDHTEVSPNMSGPGGMMQSQTEALITREQRRRERRERRQGRNRHPHIMPPPPPPVIRPMLPDILHSHYPPPYTALSLTNPPPPPSSLITPVISTVPIAATAVSDGRFTIPLPVIRRSPSERSGKGCCGQWFAGPPLRALIAVVALGGVACALGGAALGATGLAGPPTSHLTAALLMIGVGVILVTVSGAAWRMTAPGGPPCLGLGSTVDLGRCGRRPCSSRGAPHGLLYPEFQHRPPPPSYQASMQEYRLRLLLLDRDRQNGVVRGGSPPPTYRSHAGSLLRTPLSTTSRGGGGGGTSSSLGGPGSEYSLPPSYRSRNNNNNNNNSNNNNSNNNTSSSSGNNNSSHPPTVFGDESMESLGSNNFNTLSSSSQGNVPGHDYNTTTTTTTTTRTIRSLPDHSASMSSHEAGVIRDDTKDRSSTEDEISPDATINRAVLETRSQNLKEKFNPRVISSDSISCINSSPSSRSQTTKTEQSSCTAAGAAAGGASSYRKELVTIVTISASQGPDETQSEMEILAHL